MRDQHLRLPSNREYQTSKIGELNIHNQTDWKRKKYESSFKAPEARILIVDDNEMNLEVERKLLSDTRDDG